MEIKRKAKEPSPFEKRNTAILNFLLIALIPLLLVFILGFSLGKTGDVNTKVLTKQLEKKQTELDSIQNAYYSLVENISLVELAFAHIDSLVFDEKRLIAKGISDLEQRLNEIDDGSNNTPFEIWDGRRVSNFNSYANLVNDKYSEINHLLETNYLTTILERGLGTEGWVNKYLNNKKIQLNETKKLKRNFLGESIVEDLNTEIEVLTKSKQNLEFELQLSKIMIAKASPTPGAANSCQNDLTKALTDANTLKKGINQSSVNIGSNIDNIQNVILPGLEARGIFAKNKRQEISDFKEEVNKELGAIKKEIDALK